jgi:t-SNARE complex subunit (syntaxin)
MKKIEFFGILIIAFLLIILIVHQISSMDIQ